MSLDDITLAVDYFDMKKIAESGQCFRWKELGPGKYLIPSGQTCAIMEQKEPDDDLHLLIEEGTLPLWQDYLNYGERYGSTPIVCISAEVPISAGPELLAHELAHVAAGEAVEHGPEWKAAEEAIFQKYNEILNAKIPDEPVEVTVTPHKVGDGGILAMPLKANIPDPQRDDWKLVTCPICGAECWENDLARQAMAAEPELRAACTTCALKAGVTTGGKY